MIIPMISTSIVLGLAFDMITVRPSSYYIFETEDVNKSLMTIERPFTRSSYQIVESSSDANNFLNVNGELSLQVKTMKVGLKGVGDYLQSNINRENSVELLITVYHETVTKTFPSFIKQKSEWRERPPKDIGTHYIRSITYGGHLMISYILTANKEEFREDIKAAVSANLQLSGSLDGNAAGSFEKLQKSIEGKATITITSHATAGLYNPPNTLEGIFKLVDEYPKLVEESKDEKSILKLEIEPLSTLNPDYTEFVRNQAIDGIVNAATDKYDDIRIAMAQFNDWESEGHIWEDEDEDLIDKFQAKLKLANKAMVSAIGKLDISENASLSQFDEAFRAYADGGFNLPNRFTRWFSLIKHKIEKQNFVWFPYTKAVTNYIHWGGTNCTLPTPEPLFLGYAASSPSGFGNGGSVECLPATRPDLDAKKINSEMIVSNMNGLRYKLPDGTEGQVLCAYCRLENATAIYTIAGKKECPPDMNQEYRGYLNTNAGSGTSSSFVCLEETPNDTLPDEHSTPDKLSTSDKLSGTLTRAWTKCPNCEDTDKKYISCVVCSR